MINTPKIPPDSCCHSKNYTNKEDISNVKSLKCEHSGTKKYIVAKTGDLTHISSAKELDC